MDRSNEENMRLMKRLDDAWNSQDWDAFSNHHAEDVIVRWPGRSPTNGIKHIKKNANIFSMHFLITM
jgi:ketosteroid isomerase-like protein